MSGKAFKKDLPHACEHCAFSHRFGAESDVLCLHRGVVPKSGSCRKYRYDATKRIPKKASMPNDYSGEDFIL